MSRMVVQESSDRREAHLLRGVLDMCVLAVLAVEPLHAYAIVERLRHQGFPQVSYGTIYPLVTRLRRQGLVQQEAVDSPSGPTRNLLAPTAAGRDALTAWRDRWEQTTAATTAILAELDRRGGARHG